MIALPTGGVSIGLGLGAAIAGELGVAITSTFTISVVTGIVAGIVQAAEQLVLVGLRVQDFKIAESISTAFAGFTGAWSAAGTAAKSPILGSLTAGKINIAEQLTLMAIGKQQHFDFAQAAAVMINTSVDPQIAKGLEGVKSIPQNVVHTASSTAINYALNGRLNWEQVAAQMLSNEILGKLSPVIQRGMPGIGADTHPSPHASASKVDTKRAAPKKHSANATKENVHRSNALETDIFKRNGGLALGYERIERGNEEHFESYIPSINKPGSRHAISTKASKPSTLSVLNGSFWQTVDMINAIGDNFVGTIHGSVAKTGAGINNFLHDPILTTSDMIESTVNAGKGLKYIYQHPTIIKNGMVNSWRRAC